MKFSLSSFLLGVAATTLIYAKKDKRLFAGMLNRSKKHTAGGKNNVAALQVLPEKRAASAISEIA